MITAIRVCYGGSELVDWLFAAGIAGLFLGVALAFGVMIVMTRR